MKGCIPISHVISTGFLLLKAFGNFAFSILRQKLPNSIIVSIITEAVRIETEFVCDSLPVALIGIAF